MLLLDYIQFSRQSPVLIILAPPSEECVFDPQSYLLKYFALFLRCPIGHLIPVHWTLFVGHWTPVIGQQEVFYCPAAPLNWTPLPVQWTGAAAHWTPPVGHEAIFLAGCPVVLGEWTHGVVRLLATVESVLLAT